MSFGNLRFSFTCYLIKLGFCRSVTWLVRDGGGARNRWQNRLNISRISVQEGKNLPETETSAHFEIPIMDIPLKIV